MKYLRSYEHTEDIKIGDYVVCEEPGDVGNIIYNVVGQFVRYRNGNDSTKIADNCRYLIKYNYKNLNITSENSQQINSDRILNWFQHSEEYECSRLMRKDEIVFFSPSKENVESYMLSNKYNL